MKKNILIILSLILMMSGCYKDKTKIGNKAISEITCETEIGKYPYEIDKWSTLTITPVVSQTIKDKELKYEWEIGHKVVSTEPVLNYVCDTLGSFDCRFRAYNEDGSTYVTFNLNVNSPYQKGLIILSNNGERGVVSFKRTDLPYEELLVKKTLVDCFKAENPNVEVGRFGGVAISSDNIYFASKSPDKFIRVTPSTFKANNSIAPKFTNVGQMSACLNSILISYDGNSIIEYLTGSDNAFFNNINSAIGKLGLTNMKINTNAIYLLDKYGYSSYAILFDETSEQLIKYGKKTEIVAKDTFKGLMPHSFIYCDKRENALLVFKDAAGKFKMFHYNVTANLIDNVVDFSGSSTFVSSSKMVAPNSIETNVIYSNGNTLYRFNYVSQNIPTEHFIKLNEDVQIKSVVLSPDNYFLYVLTYDSKLSKEYKSSLYCFDYQSKTLLWKEDEVGAEAVDMIFKE